MLSQSIKGRRDEEQTRTNYATNTQRRTVKGTALERSVGKLLGGGGWGWEWRLKQVSHVRETSFLIQMQLQITYICSVRIEVLYLIYETSL